MDDLLQSQIREGCKLALPEGLQELMSDISREVLRSQPENLYQFIANYLEALLNAREALSIACRICGEVSSCSCEPQLDDELSRIGLGHEDIVKAKNIIFDHFDKGQVQEANLLIKLTTQTNASEIQLEELQKAIRRAFQGYISKRKDLQVSFAKFDDNSTEASMENSTSSVSTQSSASDFYKPSFSLEAISALQHAQIRRLDSSTGYPQFNASVSATTLAGSYVDLPHRIPYSVHNSECENILIKSEKSVLSLLKSLLFAENRHQDFQEYGNNMDILYPHGSNQIQDTDSEEVDEAIRSIFSLDIYGARSKNSKESQRRAVFNAIQENLQESSSGGS